MTVNITFKLPKRIYENWDSTMNKKSITKLKKNIAEQLQNIEVLMHHLENINYAYKVKID